MRVFAAWVLDLLLLATIAVISFVLAFGGGIYDIAGVHVRLRSSDNAVLSLMALVAARYATRRWHPLFGIRGLNGTAIDDWSVRQVRKAATVVREPIPSATLLVLLISVAAFAVKAWFAASSPGFYSGDDVEIHEMTLGRLLRYRWPIWDLRSPVFPFGFVYPAQWAVHKLGVSDVGSLVIAGRLAIAALSTLAVWLTWKVGQGLWPEQRGYALIAAALVATAKLHVAFGSSELPRPVATVLVLCAFLPRTSGGPLQAPRHSARPWHSGFSGMPFTTGSLVPMRTSVLVDRSPARVRMHHWSSSSSCGDLEATCTLADSRSRISIRVGSPTPVISYRS